MALPPPDTILPAWLLLPTVVAAAQIVTASAAAGLNLYATIAALGIASATGLTAPLPAGMSGLENWLVIGSALVLLALDFVVDREPVFVGVWNVVHALIKPAAAALICVAAMAGAAPGPRFAACLLAAIVTLAAHGLRFGVRVGRRLPAMPTGGARWTALEVAVAVGIVVVARLFPFYATVLAAVIVLVLFVAAVGRPLRAFRLALSLQRARSRAFLGGAGWLELRDLPRVARRALPDRPPAARPPRAVRAAAIDVPGVPRFCRGWMLVDDDGALFLRRHLIGVAPAELDGAGLEEEGTGPWGSAIRVGPDARLMLYCDGPAFARVQRAAGLVEPALPPRVTVA